MGNRVGYEVADWVPPSFPSHEAMQGDYCRLEPLEPKRHSKALYDSFQLDDGGEIWAYLPYGPFHSEVEYESWLTEVSANKDPQFYAVIDVGSEKAVGVVSYLRIAPEAGSIEVGHLCYSPLLQQTVAATEAMYLMIKKVFELGYRRYEWKCNSLNEKSCNAAKRLGFSFEGVFRQADVVKGRNRDTSWFSVIDKEWFTLQNAFEAWLRRDNFDARGIQKQKLTELRSQIERNP